MPTWLSRRVLMIALFLAAVTAALAYWYLAENMRPVAAETGPLRDVVVTVQEVPADTLLSGEMLTVRRVPDRYVQPAAAATVEEVTGKVTTVTLAKDEQVLAGRLAGEDASPNRLAYRIPEGHRAITIPVNEITGVGGFVAAGDHVDLLVTQGDSPTTKTLLQNILVLAAGGVAGTQNDGEQRIVPSLTLSVTPAEAQAIALAGSTGNLRLTLRSPVDEEAVALPPTTEL